MSVPDLPDDGAERDPRAGDADGRTSAHPPAEPEWPPLPEPPDGLVVPDDARELDLDAQALRRELRAAARTARVEQLLAGRSGGPRRLSAPMVVLVLAVVAGLGALLTLLGPARSLGPSPLPLATTATAPAGSIGGLLPETTLDLGSGPSLDARLVRPAVVVLTPTGCSDCAGSVRSVVRQASEFRFRSLLVAPRTLNAGEQAAFDSLVRATSSGLAIPATDPTGRLALAFQPVGVTVVVVAPDGVVTQVLREVTPSTRLEPLLARIAFPEDAAG